MLTGLTLHYHHWQPHVPCDYFMVYPPGVTLFIHMHLYLFLPALGIIYLKIALEVARSNRRVAALTPAPLAESPQDRVAAVPGQVLEEQQRQRLNLRTLKNFGIVVGLYATCCLPYTLLCQVLVTDPFYYLQQPTTMHVFKVIKVMFVINSVINPIVYAIRFKRFGLAFRYAFKCISKDDLERYISVQFKWIINGTHTTIILYSRLCLNVWHVGRDVSVVNYKCVWVTVLQLTLWRHICLVQILIEDSFHHKDTI